jgi:4a-hydroxytetrahydrobiopterin dehydratase
MWQKKSNHLTKTWSFPDFSHAWAFASRIALLCEKQHHHADITVGWGKVAVQITTHDAGHLLTEKDDRLAKAIDEIT